MEPECLPAEQPEGESFVRHDRALLRWFLSVGVPCIVLFTGAALRMAAQSADVADPGLTLRVQSRLVVEDLLVTDAKGKPVHGLPQTAFHVFDQGQAQTIKSFEEGGPDPASTDAPVQPLPPGVFTNANVGDTHTASEVLLIDADDLATTDQMFLLQQLQRAIAQLPPRLQVAVFRVSNGRTVLIRGFSTDRADLRRAVEECLPVMSSGSDSRFESAIEQLLTVSAYLEQAPGKKNVLWFAGAFPLVSVSEDEQRTEGSRVDFADRVHVIHQIQESLAEARVSVFPVDVRGVVTYGIPVPQGGREGSGRVSSETRDPAAATKRRVIPLTPGAGVAEQRSMMRQLAEATGGKAFTENNVATEIEEAFDLGTHAYTLTYSPSNYATDESWHKVQITVDGGYRLSYRPGYLATWTAAAEQRQGFRLLNGGEKVQAGAHAKQPLLFQAKVEPDAGTAVPKGGQRVAVRFLIPTDQLLFAHAGERWNNQLLVTTYAYDSLGRIKDGKLQELDTSLTEAQWARAGKQIVSTQQAIDVPKNAKYLLLFVQDKRSERSGTLMISMLAVHAAMSASAAAATPPAAAARP